MAQGEKTVVNNRRAFHDYAIEERFEAGLVLKGTEVKALREGRGNLSDGYVVVRDGEAWLLNMHVAPYSSASTHEDVDPGRARKLLLHRNELHRMAQRVNEQGYALIPLRVYFKTEIAKVELGLGKGKRSYDRRESIARRDAARDVERALRNKN